METQSIHAQGYGPPGGGGYGGPPGGGGYGGPPAGGGGGYGGPPGGMPPGGGGFGPPPGGGYGAPPPGGYGGGGYGGPPGPGGYGPQGFGPPPGGFGPGGPMMPGGAGDVNTTLPLVLSILMIFPCCNLIFGTIALIFAIQAGNAKKMGDFETARSKAKVSYIVTAVGFVLALVAGIVQAALNH